VARDREPDVGNTWSGHDSVVDRGSNAMKTLWILAAAATFAACSSRSEEDVGAAPDRGDDTTAVTTKIDTATGQWDTTGVTGDVNAAPSDTALTPTTPSEAVPDTSGMTTPDTSGYTSPDTGGYVPDTSSSGVDTTSMAPADPSVPADPTVPADPSAPADPNMPADSTYPTPQ